MKLTTAMLAKAGMAVFIFLSHIADFESENNL
jgi:hypothetical protein